MARDISCPVCCSSKKPGCVRSNARPFSVSRSKLDAVIEFKVNEAELVREIGMEYVNVPVRAGALDDSTLERILTVLRTAGDKTVFLHCGSGNRVAGALIPYFMLDQHMEEQDAVDQAMRVGLRSAEMMEWGLDYARRKQGKET